MQKNYVNATLMLRLSLDRCQEIQSYGSHSNHNLEIPSPTSTITLLKHIGLKWYNRHQSEGKLWETEIVHETSWSCCRWGRGQSCFQRRKSWQHWDRTSPIYTSQWLYPCVAGVNWELNLTHISSISTSNLTQHKPAVLCSYKNDPYSPC